MKSFIDRGFYHTHQPFLNGKQVAILLDASIAQNPQLREGLRAYTEWQGASLAGIAASEDMEAEALETALYSLACGAARVMESGYLPPKTFLGIAGLIIFRDEIFSHLRMVFRADHRSYLKTGMYRTMPHMRPLYLLGHRLVGAIAPIPPIQNRMIKNKQKFMLMPFQPVLSKARAMDR